MNRDILKRIIARRHAALCNFSRRYTKTFSRKGDMNAGMPVNFDEGFRSDTLDPKLRKGWYDLLGKAGKLKSGESSFGDTEISDTGLKRAEVHNPLVEGKRPQGIETAENLMNIIYPYGDHKQNPEGIEAPRNLYPTLFEIAADKDLSGVDFKNTSLEDLVRIIPENRRSEKLQQMLKDSKAAGIRPDIPFGNNERRILRLGEFGDYRRILNGLQQGTLTLDDISKYGFDLNQVLKELGKEYENGKYYPTNMRDDSHVKNHQLIGHPLNQAAEMANMFVSNPGFTYIPGLGLAKKGSHGYKNLENSAQDIIAFLARNSFGK